MVRFSEQTPDVIKEDNNSSSYLPSSKMKYIDINWDGNVCDQFNKFGDEFKELTLNCSGTISLESYPPNHIFPNKVCQITSSSHQKYKSNRKEIFRNKTKPLQNEENIKAPVLDLYITDNSNEECCQAKTMLLTDEKSIILEISNENVVDIKNLSDKYENIKTHKEVISNRSSEKQKFSSSDISILSSCINDKCFLSKENIDIHCLQNTFSQNSYDVSSPLNSSPINSTEPDTSDLAEQFVSILKISEIENIVEDKSLNEVILDNGEADEDDGYNVTKNDDFSDKSSLPQRLWNSRGRKNQQIPGIPKDDRSNQNIQTPCKRPLDDGCSCNDNNNLKNSCCTSSRGCSITTSKFRDISKITPNIPNFSLLLNSENGKKTPQRKEKISVNKTSNSTENCNNHHSYVTENLDELKEVYEFLGIECSCDMSPTAHPEACPVLNFQPNDCQELPVPNSSFVVSTESCNSNITKETSYIQTDFYSNLWMFQPPNSPSSCGELMVGSHQNQRPYLTRINVPNIPIQPVSSHVTAIQQRKIIQQIIDSKTKEDFGKTGENGTCLHEAAERNDSYLLEALLKKLDKLQFKQHIINLTNNYQQTALHLAVMKNFPSIVHILIKHEADVNKLAKSNTADSSKREAPLHLAASRLEKTLVKELLMAKDINLDLANSNGQTALHCAIQAPQTTGPNRKFIISKLIKMNADPSFKDKEHKNILMYAIEFDDYVVINDILKTVSWKYIKKMVTDKSRKGETCLTLVNSLDTDDQLFSKRRKLAETLGDFQQKIARELQDAQPQ